jgi:hypothetical protein
LESISANHDQCRSHRISKHFNQPVNIDADLHIDILVFQLSLVGSSDYANIVFYSILA